MRFSDRRDPGPVEPRTAIGAAELVQVAGSARFAVIASRTNGDVVLRLLEGAVQELPPRD